VRIIRFDTSNRTGAQYGDGKGIFLAQFALPTVINKGVMRYGTFWRSTGNGSCFTNSFRYVVVLSVRTVGITVRILVEYFFKVILA